MITSPVGHYSLKDKKQLLYRCWHRGIREIDLILGNFLEAHLNKLTSQNCADLNLLLDCNDQDLLEWISRKKKVPSLYASEVMMKVQSFAASFSNRNFKQPVSKEAE